jgi:hypothetical protein
MNDYKIGDKVCVVTNEYVTECGCNFHHFEIGEKVRVIGVSHNLINCKNSKGLTQELRPRHIKLIERYKKGD